MTSSFIKLIKFKLSDVFYSCVFFKAFTIVRPNALKSVIHNIFDTQLFVLGIVILHDVLFYFKYYLMIISH